MQHGGPVPRNGRGAIECSGNNSCPCLPITACPSPHPLAPGRSAGLEQGNRQASQVERCRHVSLDLPMLGAHVFIYPHSSASGLAGVSPFCYQYFPVSSPCLLHPQRLPTQPTLQKVDCPPAHIAELSQLPQPLSTHAPNTPGLEHHPKTLKSHEGPRCPDCFSLHRSHHQKSS